MLDQARLDTRKYREPIMRISIALSTGLLLGFIFSVDDVLAAPSKSLEDRLAALNYKVGKEAGEIVDFQFRERVYLDSRHIVVPGGSSQAYLVTLQEVDSVTSRTNGIDQAAELGHLTGLRPVFGRFMPYQGGAYGMALLSRWPISETANVRLPDGEEPRTALTAVVTSPKTGRSLRLVGIHFYRTAQERLAQAVALEDVLRGDPLPTILAGDFNSTPDSEVMVHLARSWDVVAKGEDHLTFPSYGPVEEIDYFLLRSPGRLDVVAQRLLDEPVASDHRPLLLDLLF